MTAISIPLSKRLTQWKPASMYRYGSSIDHGFDSLITRNRVGLIIFNLFEDGKVGFGLSPLPFNSDFFTVTAAPGGFDHVRISEIVKGRLGVD